MAFSLRAAFGEEAIMLHLPGPQILQQVVSLPGPLTPSSLPHLFCARAHSLCHRPGKASECAAACLCLGTGRNNAWWVCGQGPEGTMHGGSVVRDQVRKEQCMVDLRRLCTACIRHKIDLVVFSSR